MYVNHYDVIPVKQATLEETVLYEYWLDTFGTAEQLLELCLGVTGSQSSAQLCQSLPPAVLVIQALARLKEEPNLLPTQW